MTTNNEALRKAQELWHKENLEFPPLPKLLQSQLQATTERVFSTRTLTIAPYNLNLYVEEFLKDPSPKEYALIGFDGYGTNTWALHYFLVAKPIAIFLQLPWGGIYLDTQLAARQIAQRQNQIQTFLNKTTPPTDNYLVVVESLNNSYWGWHNPKEPEQTAWQQTGNPLAAAMLSLP